MPRLPSPPRPVACKLTFDVDTTNIPAPEGSVDSAQVSLPFVSVSVVAKKKGRRPKSLMAPRTDFSDRRMTRGAAKLQGYKPTSAIPVKPRPPRQPRAKKPKIQDANDQQPSPKVSENGSAPIPINVMQNLGASLGISPDKLTVEQLMAEPKKTQHNDVPNDK